MNCDRRSTEIEDLKDTLAAAGTLISASMGHDE